MMILFAWGRIRYDIVAMLALMASVAAGIVPAKEAFSGFGDDIVIIIASALMISAAIARSGVTEYMMRPLSPYLTTVRAQVFALSAIVAFLSGISKNVGALAIMIPVAFQLARRFDTPPSQLLMPMSFGSLLGGMATLIGSSPNILVSRVREEVIGQPFRMFDYAPVGLSLALLGLACLAFTYRLLPSGRKGTASLGEAINIENYTAELKVPEGSKLIGARALEIERMGETDVKLKMVVRERFRRYRPTPALLLQVGDVLLLEGEPDALERVMVSGGLEIARPVEKPGTGSDEEDVGVVESVVQADSIVVGRTVAELDLARRHRATMIAVSRSGESINQRLRSVRLLAGDVVALQGRVDHLPEVLQTLGLLPLAERELALGNSRQRWVPVIVLAVAMLLAAVSLVPVAIAFFGAALTLMLVRALPPREAYDAIEWPTIVLLGALIPVSEAIRSTGGTELISGWLSTAVGALPPIAAIGLIMVTAMAVTPFLNNAATVLVMAPISVGLASRLQLSPDPFLMAVAIGAASDFLTPFGHQCNTLVMGPGGYRFGDYWKLGLPLSVLVVAVGVPLIAFFWPLQPR